MTRLARPLALLLLCAPLFAGPSEVPALDAKLGTGDKITPLSPTTPLVVTPTLDLAVPGMTGLSPLQPMPSVLTDESAPVPQAGPQQFQQSLQRVEAGEGQLGATLDRPAAGESDAQSAGVLFDLSAQAETAAHPPDLPLNSAGRVLAGLRLAGQERRQGPGAIPGIDAVTWIGPAGRGNSGETSLVAIGGKTWYLKRLGRSADPEIDALPPETRAANEAGLAAVLREDPQLSRSFKVSPRVSAFRNGPSVLVLSEGLPSTGDGESVRRELTTVQRADASIIQLVLGLGDMHGADVLPLSGGDFGLVDFEKLSRAPLESATPRQIDEQVLIKNFPLVDRLSENDPAVYRERFAAWLKDFEAGGRARMDRTLAGEGWSRGARAAYLSAVDRNAATYFERLQPYLDYGNGWHRRIIAARAEKARSDAAAKKKGVFRGLFGGS